MTQETPDEQLTERVIVPMTKTMVAAIADYRFEHRIESKAEAVRSLVAAGLKAESKKGRGK